VYTGMEWWTKVRLEVSRGEKSKREVLRDEGIHWETLKKILMYSSRQAIGCRQARAKQRLVPTWSGSLKSSKKTKACRRNNAILRSGFTNGSGDGVMGVNTPR